LDLHTAIARLFRAVIGRAIIGSADQILAIPFPRPRAQVVGTIGCGRIGQRVLRRLRGFDCGALLYTDYARLPAALEAELGAEWVPTKEELVARCDVVTLNCPLHAGSKGMVDAALLAKFKRGAFLVNTARGGLCVAEDVAAASRSGQLGGYAGDVWFPQPAPADHPWRAMPRNAMTPHCSGTTLDAQARYAAGVRDALARVFEGRPLNAADVIVQDGKVSARARRAASRSRRGDTTALFTLSSPAPNHRPARPAASTARSSRRSTTSPRRRRRARSRSRPAGRSGRRPEIVVVFGGFAAAAATFFSNTLRSGEICGGARADLFPRARPCNPDAARRRKAAALSAQPQERRAAPRARGGGCGGAPSYALDP
jgi:hypothetical protein